MNSLLSLLLVPAVVLGATINPRQSTSAPTRLTGTSAYSDAARYAQSAYCPQSVGGTVNGATVSLAYGNGGSTPEGYVAYNAASDQIIVAHEGTTVSSFDSLKVDADLFFTGMDSRLSGCGFPSAARVHSSFQRAWASTADAILAEVNSLRSQHSGASVLVTGHSLGAAIATLDIAFLKCKISGINLRGLTFASPRAGNKEFANAVPSFTNVINGQDIVPSLPPKAFGYLHSAGEVWINPANSNTAYTCPGQENVNCADGVATIQQNAQDHVGTYFGVRINGCSS